MIKYKNKEQEKEICCNYCNTSFLYCDNDIIDLDKHNYGFICPECGNEIVVKERIPCHFPDSFFRFGTGKILTDKETQEYIDTVKRNLEDDSDDFSYSYIGSGDTFVFGTKEDGNYIDIYVAKNYWHDSYSLKD